MFLVKVLPIKTKILQYLHEVKGVNRYRYNYEFFVPSFFKEICKMSKGRTPKLPKTLRLLKPTDMTIHWKALEEHFLMVTFIVFRFNHIRGEIFPQNLGP
jgi:hypothetical protein